MSWKTSLFLIGGIVCIIFAPFLKQTLAGAFFLVGVCLIIEARFLAWQDKIQTLINKTEQEEQKLNNTDENATKQ